MNSLEVKKDIFWVGALDPNLRIFDIIMYTPFGTTYNSYVVKGDKKTAVFETVKEAFFPEYLERLTNLGIDISKIDYIITNHTEPDHAGSVAKLLDIAKGAKIVGSANAIRFLKAIANRDFEYIEVKDNDTLSLGNKTLRFISAPFLHWPDSIYTYVEEENLLLTCDSFGTHYCSPSIYNDLIENKEDYYSSLRYYYDCIMSPFKPYILKAIDKISGLKIETICPGHGPILRKNPMEIVQLYKNWSLENKEEENKVSIFYVSAYGYTKTMAEEISEGIKLCGNYKVNLFDLIQVTKEEIQEAIVTSKGLIFGSPTINGDALEPVLNLLNTLSPMVHKNKYAAAFGSYGWSGEAVPNILRRLKEIRLHLYDKGLKVNFKPSSEELLQCKSFGKDFINFMENSSKKEPIVEKPKNKKWKCVVCGLIIEAATPPEVCPVCGATKEQFIEVTEEKIAEPSSKEENYVIIGNGAAGYYAAEEIRKRNLKANIKIISAEKCLSYYRPKLTTYLSERIPDEELFISPLKFYKERNVELLLGTYVVGINRNNSSIIVSDGESKKEITYSKLILANGSSSFLPQTKGSGKIGVFTLRDIKDAENIRTSMKASKEVVIIGGGLLGLEAAFEMNKLGLKVTVIERSPILLSKQLDKMGANFISYKAKSMGISILLGESLKEIKGDAHVSEVLLESGAEIPCQTVLFSIGISPNTIIAQNAGIEINRGVVVNDKMETSVENIYACGDVAEYKGIVFGNWTAAMEMGKIAGINASGFEANFENLIPAYTFIEDGLSVFSCGDVNLKDENNLKFVDEGKDIYKKLVFKDGCLTGAILINSMKDSTKIMELMKNKSNFYEVQKYNII